MAPSMLISRFRAAALVAGVAVCLGETSCFAMIASRITAARLHAEIGGSSVAEKPNFVFSPLSILDVFHAAQKGAAGETLRQMDTLVGPEESFSLPKFRQPRGEGDAVVVEVANRLFVSNHLQGNKTFGVFKETLEKDSYEVATVDFADQHRSAEQINGYVEEKTRNHIRDIIDPSSLGFDTRLVLVNAVYFKAPWLTQFPDSATAEGTFFTPFGPKQVLFMKGLMKKAPLLYIVENGVTCVGLPYRDERLRMYVFMPDDLEQFEVRNAINPQEIESYVEKMEVGAHDKPWEEQIHLSMPKFELPGEVGRVDLVPIFKRLGVTDMFDAAKADFSGIGGNREIYAKAFVHEAYIDVEEEGTEAAAATAMIMGMRAMPVPKREIVVKVDKPFMFQLRFVEGDTSIILFCGRIADPSQAQ